MHCPPCRVHSPGVRRYRDQRFSEGSRRAIVPILNPLGERPMPSILVRDLEQKIVERLTACAGLDRRSRQREITAILNRTASTLTMDEARRISEPWHRRRVRRGSRTAWR